MKRGSFERAGLTLSCDSLARVVAGVLLSFGAQTALAQAGIIGVYQTQSAGVLAARAAQSELAQATGVELSFFDRGRCSETRLDGVPPELSELRIESEYDLLSVIHELYPYSGFRGTETLEFIQRSNLRPPHGGWNGTQYTFREDIDGIPTNQFVFITVKDETKRIDTVGGTPQMDCDFDRVPTMSAEAAIERAIYWVRHGTNPTLAPLGATALEGPHKAEVVYETAGNGRELVASWLVELISADAPDMPHHFLVTPDGKAIGTEIAHYR
jgi:hypothetical protein